MSYHDNKLKMVSLDDNSDLEYKPTKKADKKGAGSMPKSSISSAKAKKPTNASTASKRKRGSNNDIPTKTSKQSNVSSGDSLANCTTSFHNTYEDVKYAGAQFMTPPNSERGQSSFDSGRFGENGLASSSEMLLDSHTDILTNGFPNGFPNGFDMCNGLNIDTDADMNNVVGGYMNTGMSNNIYDNNFNFLYDTASINFSFSNPRNTSCDYSSGTIDPSRLDDFDGSQESREHRLDNYGVHGTCEDDQITFGDDAALLMKNEKADREYSVSSPLNDSEFEDSDHECNRPSKLPKINKNGVPRKPRQPRPKLLKWNDDDWKNVALGLVWACGENGIQIPFDQAAQVVGNRCTAGALQQALLKLRAKQLADGHQIPSLKMTWTRKKKDAPASSSANSKKDAEATPTRNALPKKKPTLMGSTQALVVTLKRPYKEADRTHLVAPFKWANNFFQKLMPAPAVYDWNVLNSGQDVMTLYTPNPSTPSNSIAAESYMAANPNSFGMPQGNSIVAFSNGGGEMSQVSWEHLHQLEGDVAAGMSLEDFLCDDMFL